MYVDQCYLLMITDYLYFHIPQSLIIGNIDILLKIAISMFHLDVFNTSRSKCAYDM